MRAPFQPARLERSSFWRSLLEAASDHRGYSHCRAVQLRLVPPHPRQTTRSIHLRSPFTSEPSWTPSKPVSV